MKKILLIMLSILLLNSCDLKRLQDERNDNYYTNEFIKKTDLYYPSDFDVDKINSVYDIAYWVKKRVEDSDEYSHTWRSVEEMLSSGKVNCKGYSLIFINLYYIKYGVKCSMLFVDTTRTIVEGGEIDHAVVEVNGKQIDPQYGWSSYYVIGYKYSFDELLYY
jgi:hypothetical protein